jgi:Fic family protein
MPHSNSLQIPPEILNIISGIDEFKGAWRAAGKLAPSRLAALRRVARTESVGASIRLDGGKVGDREVSRLLSGPERQGAESRDGQDVAGYAALLDQIHRSWQDSPFTEESISQWQRTLLRHRLASPGEPDRIKNAAGAAPGANGTQLGFAFEAPEPPDKRRLMAELIEWWRNERASARLHPLLIIAIFIAGFLDIEPFDEGNGGLARALATFLLLRAGYAYVPFSSLEAALEAHKEAGEVALRQTRATIRTDNPNWQPWLTAFLNVLDHQVRRLERKLEREKSVLAALPAHSLRIVEFAREHGRVTMAEAIRLTGASRHTLKLHFRQLVEGRQLRRFGAGRGAWYEID